MHSTQKYNVLTGKFEDLFAADVADSTKVNHTALQNVASIVGLLLTMECIISEISEEKYNCCRVLNSVVNGMI